jgi:hypothetical protein
LRTHYKIFLTVLLTVGVGNASYGDDQTTCNSNVNCFGLSQPGNQGFISRTEVQPSGTTAPNVEYLNSAQTGTPFRVSIDGNPVDASNAPNSADLTRRKDMVLEASNIQIHFDGFETTPVLNVTAFPDGAVRGEEVTFTPYSNYAAFIKKAELRIFPAGTSLQKDPLAVVEMSATVDEDVTWQVPKGSKLDGVDYVLRVYDGHGHFDETEPKLLHFLDKDRPVGDEQDKKRELLIGYGENHRYIKNISVNGGAITVNGDKLLPNTKVSVMGRPVPVDSKGKFAYRQIVPAGEQAVSVVTQDENGARRELTRQVDIPKNDWFYVVMGDLTVGKDSVHGPKTLVTGEDTSEYRGKTYTDGQLAFYARGKINDDWRLTASADTQEQPVQNLFSNFSSKDPQYLLLRLDPSQYYPVYGDDSTAIEDAPTQGKFYVRLQNDESQLMWGNFKTEITGTDLMNYSRTLYGADGLYKSKNATRYGEKRIEVNGFAADPGSLGALEEYRGTGGSLYYLRNQDVVVGSEQIRIEIRDQDSGIVLGTQNLVYGQDYQIDYIQGRVILTQPLASTANTNTIVSTSSLTGNPAYLVVGYEYTPGVTAVNDLTKGGRISDWVNDNLKLGVTGYQQGGSENQKLLGADTTLRYKPGTYIKLETAYSDGSGNGAMTSQDGGFNFNSIPQTVSPNQKADAYRAETALDLSEITQGAMAGKLDAYMLNRQNGFSSPGELTNEDVKQEGVTAQLPVNKKLEFNAKLDDKSGSTTGVVKSAEESANYHVNPADTVTLAVREDDRESALSAGASQVLSQTGNRTDGAIKIDHAPLNSKGEKERYEVYVLGQATLNKDDTRSSNNRGGVGGKYDINKKVSLTAEATDGNGGIGGKAGVEYRASDRTTYYTNYLVDTDRSDIGYAGRDTSITSGVKSRYTDSLSVFGEESYHSVDNGPSGLLHSYGLDLAANDKWTYGVKVEKGTLSDPTNGDDERTALSLSTGYHCDKTKYSGTLEWRDDDSNVNGKRTSWLMKNNLAYQTTPDWRFLGGADFAISNSNVSDNLDANYTKLSLGYAYRPVQNDKLNVLFKYVYLDDLSSPGQLSASASDYANEYKQQSHVIDADAIYDLMPKLSIGGKFGFRLGELEDTTVNDPQWFASQAWLAVARVDYHIVKEWDITAEFHCLDAQEAGDANYGALLGIYRHINKNTKAGVGYNFSDFSDDLTDLSYKSRGVFFNVLGEF